MESPAVSGATDYQNLCLAAKAEEKCLAELRKRRQYLSDQHTSSPTPVVQELNPLPVLRVMLDQGAGALSYIAGTVDGLATFCQTVEPQRGETLDNLREERGPRCPPSTKL